MDFPVELSPKYLKLARDLGVKPEDMREHIARGGGPGGQKINKTNIAVTLKHVPTNTIVRVQRYRQQSANRLAAYHRLLLKIEVLKKGKESELRRKKYKRHKQKMRRSRRSKEKMLEQKHRRSEIKEARKKVDANDT
jgi:protein subunit release factor B